MNSSESALVRPAKAASPTRARCTSKRRDGEDCQGFAVERGLCIAHSGRTAFTTETGTVAAKAKALKARERRVAQRETLRDKLARQLEEQAGMISARLADIAEHGTHADSLRAIEAWINRVYGKPTERLEVQEQGEDVADLSLTELLAERDRIMQASTPHEPSERP